MIATEKGGRVFDIFIKMWIRIITPVEQTINTDRKPPRSITLSYQKIETYDCGTHYV